MPRRAAMPRTAATARRPSRRPGTPTHTLVPALTGFTASPSATRRRSTVQSRAQASALTAALQQPVPAASPVASATASVKTLFSVLETGTQPEVIAALKQATAEQLSQSDRTTGNNALHYLARNTNLNGYVLAELMYLYGDNIDYKANKSNETPLMIALAHPGQPFDNLQVYLGEETDLNRKPSVVHPFFKNEHLPIEDFNHILTQLTKGDIHISKWISGLPLLAKNLVNRHIGAAPSPETKIKNVRSRDSIAIDLFNEFVLYIGLGPDSVKDRTETLNYFKTIAKTYERNNKILAFIKALAKPLFTGQTQLEGKTKETYGNILNGGKKKRATRATTKAKP